MDWKWELKKQKGKGGENCLGFVCNIVEPKKEIKWTKNKC